MMFSKLAKPIGFLGVLTAPLVLGTTRETIDLVSSSESSSDAVLEHVQHKVPRTLPPPDSVTTSDLATGVVFRRETGLREESPSSRRPRARSGTPPPATRTPSPVGPGTPSPPRWGSPEPEDDANLSNLPAIPWRDLPQNLFDRGVEDLRACSICQLDIDDAACANQTNMSDFGRLPCGHIFHRKCFKLWANHCIDKKRNFFCPNCKEDPLTGRPVVNETHIEVPAHVRRYRPNPNSNVRSLRDLYENGFQYEPHEPFPDQRTRIALARQRLAQAPEPEATVDGGVPQPLPSYRETLLPRDITQFGRTDIRHAVTVPDHQSPARASTQQSTNPVDVPARPEVNPGADRSSQSGSPEPVRNSRKRKRSDSPPCPREIRKRRRKFLKELPF